VQGRNKNQASVAPCYSTKPGRRDAYITSSVDRVRDSACLRSSWALAWPVHDIVITITNIVWCMAYQREVEGGSYIAQ